MKIKNLTIKNFKAFYGKYTFDFCDDKGNVKNILIYGENGSGKSSLYWALYHMFYSFKKSRNVVGYKNIFSKEEPLIKLEFDNGEHIIYDEKMFKFSNDDLKEICEKISKLKLFLSYRDTFLLNELFDYNISKEIFLDTLSTLYEGDIKKHIDKYKNLQKELDVKINSLKCSIDKTIVNFKKELKNSSLVDNISEELVQYEDIKKYDKEGDFIGYETIYYFYDYFIDEIKKVIYIINQVEEVLDPKSDLYEEFKYELDDYVEIIEEKSEDRYIDNPVVRDRLEIESLSSFELLKNHFQSFINLYEVNEDYKKTIELLNTEFSNKLKTQMETVDNIIKQDFGYIDIDFKFSEKIEVIDKQKHNPLKPIVKINDENIKKNHLKFLNEAKLSSINIAFYLSIILSYAELSEFKLLVIDDLLLSLDLSNRHNFLNLLLKYFDDYQIIILTHDKAFFEVAKRVFEHKQKDKWKYYEMYIDESGDFEKPILIEHKGYFEKAKYYFAKCDYPACANYLRKEVERILKQLLCKNIDSKEYNSLQDMINKFKQNKSMKNSDKIIERANNLTKNESFIKFDKNKLDNDDKRIIGEVQTEIKEISKLFEKENSNHLQEILPLLEQFKDTILNPQSHDDIIKPLYKKELKELIELIKDLRLE